MTLMLGTQFVVLVIVVIIGLIGVAIMRGVPAGSFVLGVAIFTFGFVLSVIGFGLALMVGYDILRHVFGAC